MTKRKKNSNRAELKKKGKEADACLNTRSIRDKKGRFLPGVSGNKKGRPKTKEPKPRHTVNMPEVSKEDLQKAGWMCIFDSRFESM